MILHLILPTCLIWTLQSLSHHLSQSEHGRTSSFNHHEISPPPQLLPKPRRLQESNFEARFINLTDPVEEGLVAELLDGGVGYFYRMSAPEAYEILVDILVFRQLLDANTNFDAVDTSQVVMDIAEPLRNIHGVTLCQEILDDFDVVLDGLTFPSDEVRRRRRLPGHLDEAIAVIPWFQEVIDAVFDELSEGDIAELNELLPEYLLNNFILGEGWLEFGEAVCNATIADTPVAVESAVQNLEQLLADLGLMEMATTTAMPVVDDDDDSSESSESDESDESVDDARNVNEVQDDLDLDKMRGQNEDGSEVVTLRIATSTMMNIWIGFIVFCGFNITLFWFFMRRNVKKSVYYETADEPPSISINH